MPESSEQPQGALAGVARADLLGTNAVSQNTGRSITVIGSNDDGTRVLLLHSSGRKFWRDREYLNQSFYLS